MKKSEAIEDYKKLTYDLACIIGKLAHIRSRVEYINNEMKWDGMFEIEFGHAIEKLGEVQAAMVTYSMEDEYMSDHVHELESELKAFKGNLNDVK